MKRYFLCALVLVLSCGLAAAQTHASGKNYSEPGGERLVIQGSLDVASGGDLDVESGGALKIAGTAVTASAAEINVLDGATATSASLNVLAAVTASASELNIMDGKTFLSGGSKAVANATTAAITISGLENGGSYFAALSWESASADPGLCTWAITTDTLTVTSANATTGTVHAIVLGLE